jgi:hypothetical protein
VILRSLKYQLLLLLLISSSIIAQNTSTYTRYGIGDIFYGYSARTMAMSFSGSAMLNSDYVEIINPASWAALTRTRIEFSFSYDDLKISNSSQSQYYGDAIFRGFTFAFPVSQDNGIAVALGIVPYSRINYESIQKVDDESTGNYIAKYDGVGGLSRIFIGGTVMVPYDFILGATLDYYFGNLNYTSSIDFINTATFPSKYDLQFAPTGFGTTLGLITPNLSDMLNSSSITNFRFGLSANIISNLDTDTSFVSRSKTIIDSLYFGKTKMVVPTRFNAGVHITLNNVYNFALDYFYQPWTNFKLSGVNQLNLSDVNKFSLGFEYRPARTLSMNFLEQIMLRAGVSYEMSQYEFNGYNLHQISVSGGFSLPLSPENTFDVGMEYSIRGSKENDLLQENFFRIDLGISFGDIWFTRYEK